MSDNQQAGPSAVQRRRLACTQCREIKIRCLPVANTPANSACQRCVQHKIGCTYQARKYGHRLRASASATSPTSLPFTTARDQNVNASEASNTNHIASGPQYGGQTSTISPSANPDDRRPLSDDHHRHSTAGRAVEADVTMYLDPDIEAESGEGSEQPFGSFGAGLSAEENIGGDDPVYLQYLSTLEAERLFASFHQLLNPIIAILDPTYHSLPVVRQSTILFTSILAVSAKFCRPNLYRDLISHAQTLLNRAISSGTCDIGVVKALLVLVFWKDPTDKSAWVKIGTAIRLGYQLGLHSSISGNSGDTEVTNELRDARRTWYCLSCADKAYSELFNLPIAIPLEYCMAPDHRAGTPIHSVDAHLACSMGLSAPHLLWLKMKRNDNDMTLTSRRMILEDVFTRFHHHMNLWFPYPESPDETGQIMSLSERTFLKWIDLIELMRLKFELLDCCIPPTIPDILQECLIWAVQIADQTERVADLGILLYLQDTSATRLSTYGTMLYKLFWRLNPTQQKTAVGLLKRVYRCCSTASKGDKSAATAFVARFLHRCLRNLSIESRVNSRHPSPDPIAQDRPMEAIFEIRDFLQDETAPSTHIQGLDSQYWATLFANPPMEGDIMGSAEFMQW